MSKYTLVLDSSQISTYFECPQKWHNMQNKRLEPISFIADESMNAGTYGHKLLDIFYRLKFRGVGLNSALEQVFAYNPDVDVCECGCSKEFHCPLSGVPSIVECKRCKRCLEFRPHSFELSSKVRSKVRSRLRDYVFNYQQNDITPLSEKDVEVGFSRTIYEDSDNLFILEGRIDIIGKLQGLTCIMDHKFQTKTHWLYNKSVQVKNYMLITQVPMFVINYIRLQDKIQTDSLAREVVTLNKVELESWHKRLIQIFFMVKKTMHSKEPERRWNACSGGRLTYERDKPQYCWFTGLCEEIDPKMALAKEKQFFKIKENSWKPW